MTVSNAPQAKRMPQVYRPSAGRAGPCPRLEEAMIDCIKEIGMA
jgi:hypothetical protein